jgi:hypothetical protein
MKPEFTSQGGPGLGASSRSRVTGKTIDRKDNTLLLEVPGLDDPVWVEGKAIVRILR